jgi:hypothetical protein
MEGLTLNQVGNEGSEKATPTRVEGQWFFGQVITGCLPASIID